MGFQQKELDKCRPDCLLGHLRLLASKALRVCLSDISLVVCLFAVSVSLFSSRLRVCVWVCGRPTRSHNNRSHCWRQFQGLEMADAWEKTTKRLAALPGGAFGLGDKVANVLICCFGSNSILVKMR